MVVSPFRALATAHLQSTWNRLHKQMGSAGLWGLIVVLVLLMLFSVLPLLGGLGALGYLIGSTLHSPSAARQPLVLGAIGITFLTLFGGLMGGLSSGSRQLPWETLKGFPVRSVTLFGAELFAGAGEALTLIELCALASMCIGATIGAPSGVFFFIFIFVCHAIALLSLQQLSGSIAQRLTRQMRAMLILLPVAAFILPALIPMLVSRTDRASFETWSTRLGELTWWLPARVTLEAAQQIVAGEPTALSLGKGLIWSGLLLALIVIGA